jgi:GTP pyrophosphokinase
MVQSRDKSFLLADKSIDTDLWLQHIQSHYSEGELQIVRNACILAGLTGEHHPTPSGTSCLQEGLATAEIMFPLKPDAYSLAAAIVYSSVEYADVDIEDIHQQLGNEVASLISGVQRMSEIQAMQGTNYQQYSHRHIDNIRKMLVTMVEDARVVLIKLAERTHFMHAVQLFEDDYRKIVAQETLDIYAPLANRLGVHQIKWQLEDLAFRYLHKDTYHTIAKSLDSKRVQREQFIEQGLSKLRTAIAAANITDTTCYGRAKHIYSIYKKMQRKRVGIEEIYDALAIRVLTQSIEDCYAILGIVHSLWEQIPQEFDDYIATPKANGYRSIHTAVIGPGNKSLEVQIRTHDMHKQAELGVAAHWHYKQGGKRPTHEGKIAWLRQVLDWQKEVSQKEQTNIDNIEHDVAEDRVYVFTPKGEIKDLPRGATPLDFAYQVHSEVGHRTRGAKVNGAIVSLNTQLHTGDKVEILTGKHPQPSRDWLRPQSGYLVSSRARAKVHAWFKQQDYDKNLVAGQTLFKAELQRLSIQDVDEAALLKRFNYQSIEDLYAALGCGDLRITQIIGFLQSQVAVAPTSVEPSIHKPTVRNEVCDIHVEGVGNLLSHPARCCQPVPGDPIIGYITQGKGVSIHRKDCINILQAPPEKQKRLISVAWGANTVERYPVDISIEAYDRRNLVHDITNIFSTEKINMLRFNSSANHQQNTAHIQLTIEIEDLNDLSRLLSRIDKLPNVIRAKRERT